jgi:hypothetical protein
MSAISKILNQQAEAQGRDVSQFSSYIFVTNAVRADLECYNIEKTRAQCKDREQLENEKKFLKLDDLQLIRKGLCKDVDAIVEWNKLSVNAKSVTLKQYFFMQDRLMLLPFLGDHSMPCPRLSLHPCLILVLPVPCPCSYCPCIVLVLSLSCLPLSCLPLSYPCLVLALLSSHFYLIITLICY